LFDNPYQAWLSFRMSEGRKAVPLAISLDEESLAKIDRIAKGKGDSRSSVMRLAINYGLPAVEAGGGEFIVMDGEMSADVGKVAETFNLTRQRVILDAIRIGAAPLYSRYERQAMQAGKEVVQDQPSETFSHLARHDFDFFNEPLQVEHGRALRENAFLNQLLKSFLRLVPGTR